MSGAVPDEEQRHDTDRVLDQRAGTPLVVGGRFEVLDLIGEGGMSRVYRARDRVLDRTVVVKLLREEYGGNPDFVARFYREARAVASLQHPNIVDVYDYGPYNGTYFIAMQYIDGADLKAVIRREAPIPPQRAIAILAEVLSALGAAHQAGIIHRDVKPQNILIRGRDGAAKLTDFGIARAFDGLELTTSGSAPGTVQYMAPEQGSGGPIGPPTDLYAAGIVLYELLSGRLPFTGAGPMQVMMQHLHEPPPPLTNVQPALQQVVLRALAKDPAQRYQSAAEMLAALRAVDQSAGARTRVVVPPPAAVGRAASIGATRVLPRGSLPPAAGAPPVPPRRASFLAPALVSLVLLLVALGLIGLLRGLLRDRGGTVEAPPATIAAAVPPQALPTETPLPAPAVSTVVPPAPTATATAVPPTAPPPVPPTAPPVAPTAPPAPVVVPSTATATRAPTATPPPPPPPTAPPTAPPARPTATPTPAPAPIAAVTFSPYDLAGAYQRTDGMLYGRREVALYGVGSGNNEGTLAFQVRGGQPGSATLVLVGLDDERAERCGFEVLLNGVPVFSGPNTFPNTPTNDNGVGGGDRFWGQMRIAVPAGVLRPGQNTLTLRNTTPWTGALGIPYILISDVTLQ